jgi:hypothetical protein
MRGPIMVHTSSWKYLMDETPEIKKEILNEANDTLKAIQQDNLKILDLHRVAKGFSLRKHALYR